MRKVTAGLFYSLDGVVESPNLWQFDSFDDEMGQEMGAMMSRVDTVLLGRVGYQEWSGYWPTAAADDPFMRVSSTSRSVGVSRNIAGIHAARYGRHRSPRPAPTAAMRAVALSSPARSRSPVPD